MRAAATEGKNDINLVDAPRPEAGDYRCLCKIHACATCSGTDVKIIRSKLSFKLPYPGIFGHESAGSVIETGKNARYIKEGDMFLRPCAVYPGEKLGEYYSSWGGYAEYGLVTDVKAFNEDHPGEELNPYTKFQQMIPSDTRITPAEATMLITLKEAASFVSNAGIKLGSSILVLGAGPVAKAMCFFAKINGAGPVIAAARRDEALEWVREAGADFTINTLEGGIRQRVLEITGGRGADIILDTTGAPDLVISSLEALGPDGRAAPYATYPGENVFKECDQSRFVFMGPDENLAHDYLLYLASNKAIALRMFFTHELPFEKIQEGFELIKNKKARKVVFKMEDCKL